MREAAGLGGGQAAERLGIDRTRISNMEAGRVGVSAEAVKSLASVYQCAERAYVDALAAMAEERGKGWWEEYRGKLGAPALDLAELEHHALRMRSTHITHVPGLLQTEEYAKAVFATAVPEPTTTELRRALSFRMKRRDALDRDDPPQCTFLIHETALLLDFGGATVMRAQINQLLEASERGNITIRIIPFAAGGFPSAGTTMTHVSGPVPQLDTLNFDTPNGASFLDAPAALLKYRSTLDRIEEFALTAEKSRDFLHGIASQS
jgi:transcriptional regulator with XRE-family HTH domain